MEHEIKLRHRHKKIPEDLKMEFLAKNFRSLLEEGPTPLVEKPLWPVKREAVLEGDLILGGK